MWKTIPFCYYYTPVRRTSLGKKEGMNHFKKQYCSDGDVVQLYQIGILTGIMMMWLQWLTMLLTDDGDVSQQGFRYVAAFHPQHVSPNEALFRSSSRNNNNNYDRQPQRGTSFTSKQRQQQYRFPVYMVDTSNDDTTIDTTIHDDHEVKPDTIENHFFDSAIINHKLQGLHLSDQKLLVLQDAAKRVVQRHEEQMKEVQRQHTSTMTTSIEGRNKQHQVDIEKINRTMERRLHQMELERHKMMDELKRTKLEYTKLLETERNDHRMKMDELNTKYNQDRSIWIETERQVQDELVLVQRNATFAAEEANRIIHHFNLDMERQQNKHQSLKEKYDTHQQRYHRATTEIEQLRNEIQNLQAEVTLMQNDMERQQEQFREQMEIAESAVAAATNRETALHQTNRQLVDQVSELHQELQQQKDAFREMDEQNEISNHTRRNSTTLSRTLQRAYQYLWYHNDESSRLRVSGRWIQSVFVPRIFPFLPTRRRIKDQTPTQK